MSHSFLVHTKRGVTIFELLLSISIIAIVSGLAFSAFSGFKKDTLLDQDAFAVRTLLDEARTATLSSRDDTAWGVHFETSKAVLYKTSYSNGAPDNVEKVLSTGVTFSTIQLNGGGNDVLFNRLSGTTDEYGTTTLSHSGSSTTRSIVITPSGIVK